MSSTKGLSTKLNISYIGVQVLFNSCYLGVAGFASVFLLYAGLSNAQIGTINSISTIVGMIIQPFIGDLVDRSKVITEKKINIFMFGLTGICALILMLLKSSVMMISALYVVMICLMSVEIALSVALAFAHINVGVNINFSLARGIGSLGYSAASFVLGQLVGRFSESAVLPFILVVSVAAIACVAVFPEPGKKTETVENTKGQKEDSEGLLEFCKNNKGFVLFLLSLVLLFYSQMIHSTYLYQIMLSIGYDAAQFGTVSSVCALIELPAMAVVPFLMKKFKIRPLMLFSAVFFVIKILVFGFATNLTMVYIGTFCQIFSFAFFTPVSSYYVSAITKAEENNKAQTLLNFGRTAATVFASMIGGVMLTLAGGNPQTMCFVGAAVSAVGVVMMFLVSPKIDDEKENALLAK